MELSKDERRLVLQHRASNSFECKREFFEGTTIGHTNVSIESDELGKDLFMITISNEFDEENVYKNGINKNDAKELIKSLQIYVDSDEFNAGDLNDEGCGM